MVSSVGVALGEESEGEGVDVELVELSTGEGVGLGEVVELSTGEGVGMGEEVELSTGEGEGEESVGVGVGERVGIGVGAGVGVGKGAGEVPGGLYPGHCVAIQKNIPLKREVKPLSWDSPEPLAPQAVPVQLRPPVWIQQSPGEFEMSLTQRD